MNRRHFLTSALGLTGASMLTSRAGLASMAEYSERNFIFVFAQGGGIQHVCLHQSLAMRQYLWNRVQR